MSSQTPSELSQASSSLAALVSAVFEALFGISLAVISIYLSLRPPRLEHRRVWLTVVISFALLFVVAACCGAFVERRSRAAAEAAQRRLHETQQAMLARCEAILKESIRGVENAGRMQIAIESQLSAAASTTPQPDVFLQYEAPGKFVFRNLGRFCHWRHNRKVIYGDRKSVV